MEPLTIQELTAFLNTVLDSALPNLNANPACIRYEEKTRKNTDYRYIAATIPYNGRKYEIKLGFEWEEAAGLNVGAEIHDTTSSKTPIQLLKMTLENTGMDIAQRLIHTAIPTVIRA